MQPLASESRVLKFGVFEVDPYAGELRKSGLQLKLAQQPFQVLCILLEHPQQIVTREELQHRIWPENTFVDYDLALKKAVNRIREVLGDSAESPRFVETVPRRGYRFIAPVTRNGDVVTVAESLPAKHDSARRRVPLGISVGLGAAILLFAAVTLWQRHAHANALSQIHSIAVLPLQNLSGDPAQDYFSDGITDTLITDLAQVSGVKVISRTSVMHYKKTDKTLPEIASELNVDGIVEGTVQRSGDHVLVNAQLIQGSSDKHLWASSYERSASDVFALEREVAADIAHHVRAQVANQSQSVPSQTRSLKPGVLEAYLQGSYHLQLAESGPQDKELSEAGRYFQRAIDFDPDFAAAYVGLAEAHQNLWWPSSEDFDILKAAVDKAVLLDPSSSDARMMLANRKFEDWDWQGAEEESRRAISFNPNNAGAHDVLGESLDVRGRLEEGWKEHQIAQELDPNRDHLSQALYNRGRFDQAIASLQRWVKIRPNDNDTHWFLSQNYQRKGLYKEWTEEVVAVLAQQGLPEVGERLRRAFAASGYLGSLRQTTRELEEMQKKKQAYFPGILAQVYVGLGDNNRALYWLSEGVTHRHQAISDPVLAYVKIDPAFEPLRSDPRFNDLLSRMGLLP